MHPYRMHEMIKERGKDRVANVAQRNSVYQTIDRLVRAGLITVLETTRDERRPERTVYAITPDGWYSLRNWTADMLSRACLAGALRLHHAMSLADQAR